MPVGRVDEGGDETVDELDSMPTEEQSRPLKALDLYFLGLNCVIGSGIFLTAGDIVQHLGAAAPWFCLLATAGCTVVALCFAEMASQVEGTGGAYLYVRHAFGSRWGFLVGWVMWLSGLVGWASVSLGLGQLLPDNLSERSWALLAVLVFTLLNLLGTRVSALSNDLLAVLKMAGLGLLALSAFTRVDWGPVLLPSTEVTSYQGVLFLIFAFSGFEWLAVPGGEVENPRQAIPRSLIGVLITAGVLYSLLLALVYHTGTAQAESPLAAAAGSPWLARWIGLAGLFSVASVNAAIAFTNPRCLYALAREGWLPAWLGPDEGVPRSAILSCGLLTAVLVMSGDFKTLVSATVLISLVQYMATVAALWYLRRRENYRAHLLPLAATLFCAVLLVNTDFEFIYKMAFLLATGLPFFLRARD